MCCVLPGYRARPGGGGAEPRGAPGSREETQEDPEEGREGPAEGRGEDGGEGGPGEGAAVTTELGLPHVVRSPGSSGSFLRPCWGLTRKRAGFVGNVHVSLYWRMR